MQAESFSHQGKLHSEVRDGRGGFSAEVGIGVRGVLMGGGRWLFRGGVGGVTKGKARIIWYAERTEAGPGLGRGRGKGRAQGLVREIGVARRKGRERGQIEKWKVLGRRGLVIGHLIDW